jgi:hypothetical protein
MSTIHRRVEFLSAKQDSKGAREDRVGSTASGREGEQGSGAEGRVEAESL